MSKKVAARSTQAIETMQQFRQLIAGCMGRMKDGRTLQSTLEELKEIMRVHVTSTDRMNVLISLFAEQNEHMGVSQRKEGLKLFGIMGEVFEDSLLAFVPKVLAICTKRLEDPQLHAVVSDSLGAMVHHMFKHISVAQEKVTHLTTILDSLFATLRASPRNVQIGVAMCLTRIVQNSPIDALVAVLGTFTDSLLDLIRSSWVRCTTQLLETLISLVLAVEYEFEAHAGKFLPGLMECMQAQKDWSTRKMAIDVVYTFAAFLPDVIAGRIDDIVTVLKERKSDKIRHVREAAQEALAKIKEAKTKSGKPLHESPPRAVQTVGSKGSDYMIEEMKQSVGGDGLPKSIFQGPVNPNFFKAAPKSNSLSYNNLPLAAIEIMTSSPPPKEESEPEEKLARPEDILVPPPLEEAKVPSPPAMQSEEKVPAESTDELQIPPELGKHPDEAPPKEREIVSSEQRRDEARPDVEPTATLRETEAVSRQTYQYDIDRLSKVSFDA